MTSEMDPGTQRHYQHDQWLTIPKHAIERAIQNLSFIEALALARAAYRTQDDRLASLEDAKDIVDALTQPD